MPNAYSEKLKDPRWQKKRLEVLDRDGWTCQWCFDAESTLHVHHLWYCNGEPWEVGDAALITLCESCHETEGKSRKNNEDLLLQACKEARVNSSSILNLAIAIHQSKIQNEVPWDAMCWGIDHKEMREEIYDKYMDQLCGGAKDGAKKE